MLLQAWDADALQVMQCLVGGHLVLQPLHDVLAVVAVTGLDGHAEAMQPEAAGRQGRARSKFAEARSSKTS